mmetsp:Transcript_109413/g.304980  ORF Transcript_109413/g.304980 Transcript_109413/m.304980 type:complete len:211 (-) Transcript_109413:2495-3127(-)
MTIWLDRLKIPSMSSLLELSVPKCMPPMETLSSTCSPPLLFRVSLTIIMTSFSPTATSIPYVAVPPDVIDVELKPTPMSPAMSFTSSLTSDEASVLSAHPNQSSEPPPFGLLTVMRNSSDFHSSPTDILKACSQLSKQQLLGADQASHSFQIASRCTSYRPSSQLQHWGLDVSMEISEENSLINARPMSPFGTVHWGNRETSAVKTNFPS